MTYWTDQPLERLSTEQWESLCDGCGLCCLVKLQDEEDPADDGEAEVFLTDVGCRLLDCSSCRCSNYLGRKAIVPECLVLTPESLPEVANWLPNSCAYKRRMNGQSLPSWHYLISGDRTAVHREGPGLAGQIKTEASVPDHKLEDHIIPWPAVAEKAS